MDAVLRLEMILKIGWGSGGEMKKIRPGRRPGGFVKKQKTYKKAHDPFFHEMGSDRSSRAEIGTYRRHFSGCFFCFEEPPKIKTKNTKTYRNLNG